MALIEIEPQSPQKRLSGAFSDPQTLQRQGNGAPHSPQNFMSSLAGALQRSHIMGSPWATFERILPCRADLTSKSQDKPS